MSRDFSTNFTGWLFLAAAIMLWGGWMLLPVHIGTYFDPGDFARVHASFHLWIWMFRVHIFGMVVTAMALVALASLVADSQVRVVAWPGIAVAATGTFVGALAAAFYYHHGAWGALETVGRSPEELRAFVEALRVDTEYVTCLVRFSRVFSGLGLLVLGSGLIAWKVLPAWVGWIAVAIGLAAMGVTMLLPDQMELYAPLFHLTALWLGLVGAVILRNGVALQKR